MGSMGTIGDCYDNAPMESFWGSMQFGVKVKLGLRETPETPVSRHS